MLLRARQEHDEEEGACRGSMTRAALEREHNAREHAWSSILLSLQELCDAERFGCEAARKDMEQWQAEAEKVQLKLDQCNAEIIALRERASSIKATAVQSACHPG